MLGEEGETLEPVAFLVLFPVGFLLVDDVLDVGLEHASALPGALEGRDVDAVLVGQLPGGVGDVHLVGRGLLRPVVGFPGGRRLPSEERS